MHGGEREPMLSAAFARADQSSGLKSDADFVDENCNWRRYIFHR